MDDACLCDGEGESQKVWEKIERLDGNSWKSVKAQLGLAVPRGQRHGGTKLCNSPWQCLRDVKMIDHSA